MGLIGLKNELKSVYMIFLTYLYPYENTNRNFI
ncbi:unknown [Porphyromonas sp. CAG:1061]|nr:unknown [Porphyromonas sp. CAG:1061]